MSSNKFCITYYSLTKRLPILEAISIYSSAAESLVNAVQYPLLFEILRNVYICASVCYIRRAGKVDKSVDIIFIRVNISI